MNYGFFNTCTLTGITDNTGESSLVPIILEEIAKKEGVRERIQLKRVF